MSELKELFELEVPNVSAEISPVDGMYEGVKEHYFGVGQSALRCIRLAMLASGKGSVGTILDMGCGHGRVMRTLRAAFPAARITACDVIREGVDFCARTFGAIPVYSCEALEDVRIEGPFDLVWCGSVLTHLRCDRVTRLLGLFASRLAPGGVLVFSTHGRLVVERLRRGAQLYGLEEPARRELLGQYDQDGFGYGDYPESLRQSLGLAHYGISAASPAWICAQIERLPAVRLVTCLERAWDNHQDVFGCVREA